MRFLIGSDQHVFLRNTFNEDFFSENEVFP